MQQDYDLFGKDVFKVYILEFCTKENYFEKEQYWLDKFLPHINGYNFSSTAISGLGYKRSEEHSDKISKALMGRKLSEEHKRKCANGRKGKTGYEATNRKEVAQYDSNMNWIQNYGSIAEAARKTNIDRKSIGKAALRNFKTVGEYYWKPVENNKI